MSELDFVDPGLIVATVSPAAPSSDPLHRSKGSRVVANQTVSRS
jgi:hypothetical protein